VIAELGAVVALISRRRLVHSSEEAAVLAAIPAVLAPILPAVAPTADAARHDRSGSGHRRGTRDRPTAE